MAPPPEEMWYDEVVERTADYVVFAVTRKPSGERVLYRVPTRPFVDIWGEPDTVPAES